MTRRANAQVDEPANLAEEKRLAVLESFRNLDAWLAFDTALATNVSADPDRFRHGLHRESPFGGNGGERIGGRNAFFHCLV